MNKKIIDFRSEFSNKEEFMEIKEKQKIKAVQLAKVLNITDRQIRNLANDNVIIKEKGAYLFLESIHSYINYLKTINDGDANLKDIKLKKETEKLSKDIELKSIKIAELKNTLHSAEIVEKVMTDMLLNLKGKLLSVPNKVSPLLLGIDNLGDIQEIILNAIQDTLDEISGYTPELFKNKNVVIDDEVEENDKKEIKGGRKARNTKFEKNN